MNKAIAKGIVSIITIPAFLAALADSDDPGTTLPLNAVATEAPVVIPKAKDNVVVATKRINIDGYPRAYNPALIRTPDGILLLFRSLVDPDRRPFVSSTGAVWLNDALEPISHPELISTRRPGDPTPQQSEDTRIFCCDGQLWLVYNDSVDMVNPSEWDHRDMFVCKLFYENGKFTTGDPIKLIHVEKYEKVKWQKNWQPFDWNGTMLLGYSINPHEVLYPDLETGNCYPVYKTESDAKWHWGKLRGGTPPQLMGDHYLGFFHSPVPIISETTQGRELMHYFMGAYTFSAEPPFNMTGISPYPIYADGFYTSSPLGIRCVYPGGFIDDAQYFYVAYGKDDHEVWIAILDKEKVYSTLVPVNQLEDGSESADRPL